MQQNLRFTPPVKVHTEIPIVQHLFEFHKTFHLYLKHFSRSDKFTVGKAIQTHTLSLIELSIASTLMDGYVKKEMLATASGKLDLIKLLVRLAHETNALDQPRFLLLQGHLQEVGKMLGGWLKSIK